MTEIICAYCVGDLSSGDRIEYIDCHTLHRSCGELVHHYRSGAVAKHLPPEIGWYDADCEGNWGPDGRIYIGRVVRHVEKELTPGTYSPLDDLGFSWCWGRGDEPEWVSAWNAIDGKMTWASAVGPHCWECRQDIPYGLLKDWEWMSITCSDAKMECMSDN